VIVVRSRSPIIEPFLTFLVEATWSSGRLLREYTVLLDPPTYAPPAVRQAPAVEAPRRAEPADTGRIERQAQPAYRPPPPEPEPERRPSYESEPAYVPETPYSTASAGDYVVERGETLWGIAQRMRPDARLTMSQTMLAIFEANPDAFAGNINRLKAGAALTIPSADDIFRISRSDAISEVGRQHRHWRSDDAVLPEPDTRYAEATAAGDDAPFDSSTGPGTQRTETSLILVPPDEEPADFDVDVGAVEPVAREQEIEARIAELEAADVPDRQSLLEIRDNELAALRRELAEIRGEVYETPAVDDETAADDTVGDASGDATPADDAVAEAEPEPAGPTNVVTRRVDEPGFVERIMAVLDSLWAKIVAAAVVLAGAVLWFLRRAGDDDDRPWETLDSDEIAAEALTATETMHAPTPDDAIVVVEQDSGIGPLDEDTFEVPAPDIVEAPEEPAPAEETGSFDSIDDTFSSDTALNLDRTDPLAEADFHMAYGLYDQAADLVSGALEAEPNDRGLMSKLCEIYFVWGNRDAFIEAAARLKAAVGTGESAEWDKIVIMGQQVAADHELFAGAAVAGATRAVDLAFEADMEDSGELDIDFGGGDEGESDGVDLGADEPEAEDAGVDFLLEETADMPVEEETPEETPDGLAVEPADAADVDVTAEMPAPVEPADAADADVTAEMPAPVEPTIEEPFAGTDRTSELPSLDESLGAVISEAGQDSDSTAEINLDELDLDLDLDVDGLAETEVASLDDLDETGTNEALEDPDDITGKNPEIDPDATGVQEALEPDETGIGEQLDIDDGFGVTGTGMRLAADETGRMPFADAEIESSTPIDADDATVLAPGPDDDGETEVSGDADTLLAPMDDDFDFAKTEALPPEVFAGGANLDEIGEIPAAATEVDPDLDDLNLDDLTAELEAGEGGDTAEEPGDDATAEQPRPPAAGDTTETTTDATTMSFGPGDMSEDLDEARAMTEVGTKLDLARAYVDMGDPAGARSILEEVLDEGD
ncbi:MAG: LysM peptidoglycan-binding domain-containing protein, partial [Proteobacteria bacterium]|nr:LysM peptidoglycan-binding domain-containing protein [Pseudomonadota bacterium]